MPDEALVRLKQLLENLPDDLLNSGFIYDFQDFVPDLEKVEMFGTREAAVNHALEVAFAPLRREEGPVLFLLLERGPALSCVRTISTKHQYGFPMLPLCSD
jgi:hypothetical protein